MYATDWKYLQNLCKFCLYSSVVCMLLQECTICLADTYKLYCLTSCCSCMILSNYTIIRLNNLTESKYTQLKHIYACMHARKLGDGKLKSSHKCCGSDTDPLMHDHAYELRPCMHFSTPAWMLTSHLELASNTKAGSGGPHATYY